MEKRKEILDYTKIADWAAEELSDAVANVGMRHILPSEVYAIISSRLGLESDIFTAPFAVTQNSAGGQPGSGQIDRLDDIGNLDSNISVAKHIEVFITDHPGAGIILDQETAIALSKDRDRPITLIEYSDGHCLLTGLSERGIDTFITCSMDVIRNIDGIKLFKFKP